MSEPRELTQTEGIPRKWAPVIWAAAGLFFLVALPFGVSFITERHGWTETGPSYLNLMGLALVVAGLGVVVWTLLTHFEVAEERVPYDLAAPELIIIGPYSLTRNPMYLAVVITWLGWAAFYGSLAVLIATLAIAIIFEFAVIPREESALKRRFPEAYRRYEENIPRWIPK